MRRRSAIICAVAGLVLVAGIPDASFARAAEAPARVCGAKLVAGWAACDTWLMKLSEHRKLVEAARKGDKGAAADLAEFHSMAGEEKTSLRWRRQAAERGDCRAISVLLWRASQDSDRVKLAKWKTRARWNKCDSD